MAPCEFVRTTATFNSTTCQVDLEVGTAKENMEITTEWNGEIDREISIARPAGLIGVGYTKRGIYVRSCFFYD